MAGPYTGVTTTEPQASPTPYQNLNTPAATPAMYGGQVAEGLKELGTGAGRAAVFFGEAAADNAANQYQERLNEIMHGEPGKMVQGPDGQMVPDTGFMGLKGRAAMDARPDVDKRLEQLRTEIRGGLLTPQQSLRFDDFSRRYKTWAEGRIGQHADDQANRWYDQVENATATGAQKHIAVNFNDPVAVKEGQERLREAYVKKAQRMGGGPELVQAAMDKADRETAATLVMATAVTDPLKAQRIAEKSRVALGTMYDEVMNRIKPRAEAAEGRAYADAKLTEGVVGLNESTQAVLTEGAAALKAKGIDIRVSSGVRTPEENARLPGAAKDSEHLHGGAVDIPWKGKSDAEKREILAQFSGDSRVGGIGFYDSHIHVDTKAGRRTWGAQPQWAQADMQGWKGNVAPNAPTPRTQADLINEVLDDPRLQDKPHAQQAAIARINQSYRLRNADEAKSKAAFQQREDDSVAEAIATGITTNPMARDDYVRHLGPVDGEAKYVAYSEKLKFGSAMNTVRDMSDADQRAYLAERRQRELKPDQPGFARAEKFQEQLEKAVDEMQKQRREDPSNAVSRDPAVMEAQATVNPQVPASVRNLGQIRMQAQERLGIEGDARTPISRAEALKVFNPVVMALPGQKPDALEKVASDLRDLYGPEMAVSAFVYGLRAIHAQGQTLEAAGGVFENLAQGKPITKEDQRAAKDAADTQKIQDAISAQAARNNPDWTQLPDWTAGIETVMKPAPTRAQAVPSSDDLRKLRENPALATDFDKAYGPGKAKEVMEQFPWYFQKRPGNGR